MLLALLTVNAINFIDGLDGLAAGVGAIAALALFAFSYGLSSGRVTFGVAQERISAPTLIAVVLAGACLGFLPHNFNPARVFMGDSGSMLIGLMLAARCHEPHRAVQLLEPAARRPPSRCCCRCCCRSRSWRCRSWTCCSPWYGVPGPAGRRSPPDKMHLHHRLLEIGHSHTRAVLIMYFWTALLAFSGVAISLTGGPLSGWPGSAP